MGYYGIYRDPRTLTHFGIKRRSGRYPYGSGERPYQGEKRALSYRVGEKRLQNRRTVLSKQTDKYAAKSGLENQMKTLEIEQLNRQTKDMLEDEGRVKRIGRGTIARRVGIGAVGGTAAAGLMYASSAVFGSMTLGAGAALVPIGMAYLKYRKTTY